MLGCFAEGLRPREIGRKLKMSHTTVLRIFSGAEADFPPAQIAGLLGVDNIQAVPEPETLALLALGLGVVAARTRRRPAPR